MDRKDLTAQNVPKAWDYPRFRGKTLKVLFPTYSYLLTKEVQSALIKLGHHCRVLQLPSKEIPLSQVSGLFLKEILEFKPDMVITINHYGLDREGFIARALERFKLPCASWFVDSPFLILGYYQYTITPYITIFVWDRDYIPIMKEEGFKEVHFLPLGFDEETFNPSRQGMDGEVFDLGFVGNSMFNKAKSRLQGLVLPESLKGQYHSVAKAFVTSEHLLVRDLLRERFVELYNDLVSLPPTEALAYEAAVTWESTGLYRLWVLDSLKAFRPVVAGDDGWKDYLDQNYQISPILDYYRELPGFYKSSKININATSRQMKRGLNQRIFDVPACARTLVTENTPGLEEILEPNKEVLVFDSLEELPMVVEKALKDDHYRRQVGISGARRVHSHHTYTHRLKRLLDIMKEIYH